MTQLSLAEQLERRGWFRWLESREYLAEDEAKYALNRMFAELRDALPRVRARETPEDSQRRAAITLLTDAFVGMLHAVRPPAPQAVSGAESAPDEYGYPERQPQEHRSLLGRAINIVISPAGDPRPPAPVKPQPRLRVQSQLLADRLRAALHGVDEILAAAQPQPPRRETLPWSEDRDLLEIFQNLMTAHVHSDPEVAMPYLRMLREELEQRHGIRVVSFDGTNDEFFSFAPYRPGEHPAGQTERPALVADKRQRLLRRGEARAPMPTPGPEPITPQPPPAAVTPPTPAAGTSPPGPEPAAPAAATAPNPPQTPVYPPTEFESTGQPVRQDDQVERAADNAFPDRPEGSSDNG